jgi:DNA-binding NarL/FixJ family response regulator
MSDHNQNGFHRAKTPEKVNLLDERERLIIRRVLAGKQNKEIAAELGITAAHAGFILSVACSKLEVEGVRGLFLLVIAATRELAAPISGPMVRPAGVPAPSEMAKEAANG